MVSQIDSIAGFKQIQINVEAIIVLKAIKSVRHEYKIDKHPVYTLHMAKRVFLSHVAEIKV